VIPEALYEIMTYMREHGEEEDPHAGHDHRFLAEDGEEDAHDDHAGEIPPSVIWRFGSALLGGFMIPMLFALITPHKQVDDVETPEMYLDDVEQAKTSEKNSDLNYPLIYSIVFGDALCNFADGVFVGFALLQCDMAIVWTVTAAALYHEITQEVADYFLLTKHAGLSPVKAIILNFVGGLTIVLGGIVVFSSDVSGMGVGVGLAIACGVYISIACCECFPRVRAVLETRQERALSMLCFIIGVVPLGLVLLNHIHCDAHGDEHEDH
jgi:zinc transporter ZupT